MVKRAMMGSRVMVMARVIVRSRATKRSQVKVKSQDELIPIICEVDSLITQYSFFYLLTLHVILNGESLEDVDCFKYLGSQVAADGGCERDVVHRMNEGYRAWGSLKSVHSNRGLGIMAKKCLYEGVIAPTALYGAGA